MRQLGLAAKKFRELVHGDKLYYIDPKTPTLISELTIKEVTEYTEPGKKDWCVIVYFKSDEAAKIIGGFKDVKLHPLSKELNLFPENPDDDIPVGKLIVKKNDTNCLTHSLPPSVYFTNKKQLESWMGK